MRQSTHQYSRWLILFGLAWVLTHAQAQTAFVVASQQEEFNPSNDTFNHLAHAVADESYDLVLIAGDYRVQPSSWPESEPVRRTRNLTISSLKNDSSGEAVLELEFLEGRTIIAANTTITLKDIGLGRARRSSGQQVPFFAGEGESSVLVLENVARIRTACANNTDELAEGLRRGFRTGPGVEAGPNETNEATSIDFRWRGQDFPNSFLAVDVSQFVNPGDVPETRGYDAGYTLVQRNSTRVCLSYVSDDCVDVNGVDACVVEAIEAILAEESGAGRPPIAALVAPLVVAGALLLAALAGFLLWRRRRQKRQQQQLLPDQEKGFQHQHQQQQALLLYPPHDGSGDAGAAAVGVRLPRDSMDQSMDDFRPIEPVGPLGPGNRSGSLESLAGTTAGTWKLLACHTAPEFKDATANDKIKLGVLLGAGSFGRVYKGRWHDMDVAVKVLQHDSTTAAAISNEVDLVMSFRHPNIVAAYHFVTWTSEPRDDLMSGTTGPGGFGGTRSSLQPVTENAFDSSSAMHRHHSFPRPAVVFANKDGSTISSMATGSTTGDNAMHYFGSALPPATAAAAAAIMTCTSRSSNSTPRSGSQASAAAILEILRSSRDRNVVSGSTLSTSGGNATGGTASGTGWGSRGGTVGSYAPDNALGNTAAAAAASGSSTGSLALMGSPHAFSRYDALQHHATAAAAAAAGSDGSAQQGSAVATPDPVASLSVRGHNSVNNNVMSVIYSQGSEGSGRFESDRSGFRQNSTGSTMSTSSSTAAVAAILAAGRRQQQQQASRGRLLPPKSPVAAAAAVVQVDGGLATEGMKEPSQDDSSVASRQPSSPFAAAALQFPDVQQQQHMLGTGSQGIAAAAARDQQQVSLDSQLPRSSSSPTVTQNNTVTGSVSNIMSVLRNRSSGGSYNRSSGGLTKMSDELVVDVQTPGQPVEIPAKLAALLPHSVIAAAPAAAAAVAAEPAGSSNASILQPSDVRNTAAAAAAAAAQEAAAAVIQEAPAAVIVTPDVSAPLHVSWQSEAAAAAALGSSSSSSLRSGPGHLRLPPAALRNSQISRNSHNTAKVTTAAGTAEVPGSTAAAAAPAASDTMMLQQPQSADATAAAAPVRVQGVEGYDAASTAAVGAAAAAASEGPSSTAVPTMHIVPFTPALLFDYEQRQSGLNSSSSVSQSISLSTAAAAGAAGTSNRSSGANSQAILAILPQPADQLDQQQQQQDAIPQQQQRWHVLGNFLTADNNAIDQPGVTTAAALAAGKPVVPRPLLSGTGFASFSSIGRPGARIGGTVNQPAEAQTWLILEYCNGGNLLDLLQDGQLAKHGARKKLGYILTLLLDVAAGMLYLHRRNVLHGDLKPGNILIRYESGLPYGRSAKVSDFGLSRALQAGQSHRSTRTMGTMNHTPPELLRLGRLSPAGDVYAFGIIMWEVFTGRVAFHGLHYGEVFEQVALWQKRPPVPEDMPADYATLMTECWSADPFRRPAFDAVEARLREMLDRTVQDEREAQDRFVSDL